MEARSDSKTIYDWCETLLVSHPNQIDLAKISKVTEQVRKLLECGAKADYCHDKTAFPTALHYAAAYGSPELIQLLLTANPLLTVQGGVEKKTAYDVLFQRCHHLPPVFNTSKYHKAFNECLNAIEARSALLIGPSGLSAKDKSAPSGSFDSLDLSPS